MASPEAQAALEALLFASDEPLPLTRLAEVLDLAPEETQAALVAVQAACDAPGRGLTVVEVAGGFRIVSRPETAPVLLRLQRLRLRNRLSRAAVETLAIVAYRQPISRPDIEQLRGVGAESVVAHLLERRLIRVVGRKAGPGRPILYGTTREFLEHFGLRDLGEMPPFEAPADMGGGSAVVEMEPAEGDVGIEPPETEPGLDAELEETEPVAPEVDATEAEASLVEGAPGRARESGSAHPGGEAPSGEGPAADGPRESDEEHRAGAGAVAAQPEGGGAGHRDV